MNKFLLVYRMLSYFLLIFFIVGFGLSIKEYITRVTPFDSSQLIFNIIWIYLFFCVFYFHRKTTNYKEVRPFKYYLLTGVTNFILGVFLLLFSLFVLIKYPIYPIDIEEFLRLSFLLLIGVYGILKINYTLFILKEIKK